LQHKWAISLRRFLMLRTGEQMLFLAPPNTSLRLALHDRFRSSPNAQPARALDGSIAPIAGARRAHRRRGGRQREPARTIVFDDRPRLPLDSQL
jgi:hypothetical protein